MAHRWLGFAALAVLLAVALSCGSDRGSNSEEESVLGDVPLATLLYVGFGFEQSYPFESVGGLGSTGWNVIGNDTLWSGLVVSQPEIDFYRSKDTNTIAWQLEQMSRAGISVIFISWQGWGDDNLDGVIEPGISVEYDATAKLVLDYIRENDLPFQFAILCEDFPGNFHGISLLDLTDQQRRMVMDHLWENYYSPDVYGDIAYQWDGKPLVAGGANTPGHWWEAHGFSDPRFELREIYDKPEDEDEHWAAVYYTPPPSKLPGPEGAVMIWPRHDGLLPLLAQNAPWVTQETMRRVDPLGEEGVYDQAWKEVIEYTPRSDIRLIWLWIWNSYAEMTYVEPDSGLGPYAVGDLYVRKTAHYYGLFRTGSPFEHFDDAN